MKNEITEAQSPGNSAIRKETTMDYKEQQCDKKPPQRKAYEGYVFVSCYDVARM